MNLVIPADTLTELADLGRLANVISTINGGNRVAASNIADGIADSGYLHAVITEVAEQVQAETVRRVEELLRANGFDGLAAMVAADLADDRELASL